jgi:hypothetical protein
MQPLPFSTCGFFLACLFNNQALKRRLYNPSVAFPLKNFLLSFNFSQIFKNILTIQYFLIQNHVLSFQVCSSVDWNEIRERWGKSEVKKWRRQTNVAFAWELSDTSSLSFPLSSASQEIRISQTVRISKLYLFLGKMTLCDTKVVTYAFCIFMVKLISW